ncbi:MAG: hypothetical protein AMJ65_00895 [Phycisphaerae bacterium SG8_4]|nr:MAG: hypothetical protein AMJ65_00895 [Phycisphaerae bacterium SG8_4]
MKKLGAILALALFVSAPAAQAGSTLTFDELPFQSVDGLSYKGVTFGFTVCGSPSTDAHYGGIGPGTLTYLEGKTLEGNARGILTLDFASPISQLEFGLALNTRDPVTGAYTVELFDDSLASMGVISQNTNPLIYWSEEQFTYSGTPISRAVIDFNQSYARRFAVDNLSTNTVPAPGAILLGSIGASFVGWLRRRKTL